MGRKYSRPFPMWLSEEQHRWLKEHKPNISGFIRDLIDAEMAKSPEGIDHRIAQVQAVLEELHARRADMTDRLDQLLELPVVNEFVDKMLANPLNWNGVRSNKWDTPIEIFLDHDLTLTAQDIYKLMIRRGDLPDGG